MSFSRDVKEELSRHISDARHCRIAEMAAIIGTCGELGASAGGRVFLKVVTDNLTVAKKYYILIRKTFDSEIEVAIKRRKGGNRSYSVHVSREKDVKTILGAVKRMDDEGALMPADTLVNGLVIQNTCCKRAFVRGAFLSCGSITAPSKAYHLEMALASRQKADEMCGILRAFEVEAKIVERKKHYVAYVKEGEQIVELLNVMEAHVALMDLENVRILKEVRNSVNRQVNCEMANIHKTVTAATRQVNDIQFIRDSVGLDELPDNLRMVAELRMEHSEASLKELGAMHDPPIGKSGVNHKLRKISEMADRLRK